MITIEAPYIPGVKTNSIPLPNPKLGNSRTLLAKLDVSTASMDATRYTYVQKRQRTDSHGGVFTEEIFNFDFTLQRDKAVQFLEFVRSYIGNQWKMTFHDNPDTDEFIIGYLLTNPFTRKSVRRGADCGTDEVLSEVSISMRGEWLGRK